MAPENGHIGKRDFDANRPLLRDNDDHQDHGPSLLDDDGSLVSNVADGIIERDRREMRREVIRYFSFICAILSCLCAGSITAFSLYGPLLLTRLHYTQLRVNTVSIAAEIALYLPVPLFGYLCDRYTPSPLSLLSACLFGVGYLLAAFTYRSGPPADAGGDGGWPFWVMVLAFVGVGSGTSSMYLSAVTTCAKNFGRGKHKGLLLAMPIAAFGLSGMWQSQVGTHLLFERHPDGTKGDVDVFRYFLFLGCTLFAVGVVGAVGLRVVGEEEIIDEAVEELERSGLLEESEFFRRGNERRYGTLDQEDDGERAMSDEEREAKRREREQEEEERRKKNWLLNQETRRFLTDRTMWWLAGGFFLVTGPGEAFINNLGTIIPTLTPSSRHASPPAGLPSTHVTILALTSTLARLITGTLSDLFAPSSSTSSLSRPASRQSHTSTSSHHISFSRLFFLLPSAFLLSLGFLLLATPAVQATPPLFHLTSALVGIGYGATFSLVPIIISVVWGVENFGTNWGAVAMMPAVGATVWGLIYSAGFDRASRGGGSEGGECTGWSCYGGWAVGCTLSVWVAVGMLGMAWRGWRRRGVIV